MSDITQILPRIKQGDVSAGSKLLLLVSYCTWPFSGHPESARFKSGARPGLESFAVSNRIQSSIQ